MTALHTDLLKKHLFSSFHELYPDKAGQHDQRDYTAAGFSPVIRASPISITEKLGNDWPKDLDRLTELSDFADDTDFQERFMAVKRANKQTFADFVREDCGIEINPDALFDVQIKRLHEYKRQHLNLLHILTLYRRLLNDPNYEMSPRVFVFGAKAAPGYALAKNIIRAINKVAEKINDDPRIQGRLKLFSPKTIASLLPK